MDGFISRVVFIDKGNRTAGQVLYFFNTMALRQQLLNPGFIALNILLSTIPTDRDRRINLQL